MNLYSSGRLDIATQALLSRELPLLKKRKDHYKQECAQNLLLWL